jgi:hypothetical protein
MEEICVCLKIPVFLLFPSQLINKIMFNFLSILDLFSCVDYLIVMRIFVPAAKCIYVCVSFQCIELYNLLLLCSLILVLFIFLLVALDSICALSHIKEISYRKTWLKLVRRVIMIRREMKFIMPSLVW